MTILITGAAGLNGTAAVREFAGTASQSGRWSATAPTRASSLKFRLWTSSRATCCCPRPSARHWTASTEFC